MNSKQYLFLYCHARSFRICKLKQPYRGNHSELSKYSNQFYLTATDIIASQNIGHSF
jgi:hypothetical protein